MKVATGAKRVREEEKFCCLVIHLVEVCIDTSTRLETSPPDVVSRDKPIYHRSIRPRVRAFSKKKFR